MTNVLVALLSLVMVATSLSASVCDLSCWLRRANSDCHTEGATLAAGQMEMPMPKDMDMGSVVSESLTGPGAEATHAGCPAMWARMRMTMAMFSHVQKAKERFEYAGAAETGTDAMPRHSKTISACAHEPCSEVWSSTSPPGAHRTAANYRNLSSLCVSNSVSNLANASIDVCQMKIGASPPKNVGTDSLVGPLRI